MGTVGSKVSLEDQMKENKRMITRAIRELERERRKMEQQSKKIEMDIKKAARANQMGTVRIMAKDLVRQKRYTQKFHQMSAQMQAVSLRIQTMKSTEAMSRAMKGATSAMSRMNRQMNIPQLQAIMQKFAMESEKMDMTEEVMGDTVDDVMADEEDEEEEEAVVNQVLDELGINMMETVPDVPNGVGVAAPATAAKATASTAAPVGAGGGDLNSLEERLKNLRK
eukprot:TRINITY_DN782213_c0_g1_i1.p1 TRINITY_DN782213_c0_g1~~TRINITY_DN782213_c0_g1_i1.p1  ORF type:complete len:224 (-),score=97.99 TRINITY_DN782213_c0_g1_i1:288-959(-)